MLNREALLDASKTSDVNTDVVDVPGLGKVQVREMSGSLRNRLEAWAAGDRSDAKASEQITLQLLERCVLDDQNKPVGEQIAMGLFKNRPRAAYLLRQRIFELSALDEQDREELVEGFADDLSGRSTSG